jgi:hypothetical protein
MGEEYLDTNLVDPLLGDLTESIPIPSVFTDQEDYAPGETATITATGFEVGSTIEFSIADDPDDPGDDGEADVYQPFSVTDGGEGDLDGVADGNITTTWFVPTDNNGTGSGTPDALNATLNLTARGSNGQVATTTFTDADAKAAVQIDQWSDGEAPDLPVSSGAQKDQWQNGNLGAQQAHYNEGESVPYRNVFTGLNPGVIYTIVIEWDTTENSGKHALDYLTTWDRNFPATRNETPPNPLIGVSGITVSPTTLAIPIDPGVTNGQNGTPGGGDDITQIPGNFTLWNGTLLGYTDLDPGNPNSVYGGSTNFTGATTRSLAIQFQYTGPETTGNGTAVLAWGGHISTRADWGQGNSAVSINGSPYHMRLIDFDDPTDNSVGVGQQDRSLSNDAVIYPSSITIKKETDPDGSTQMFDFSFVRPANTVDVIAGGYLDLSGDGVISTKDDGKFKDSDNEIYSVTDGGNITRISGSGDGKINGFSIIGGLLDTSENGTIGTEDRFTNLTGTGSVTFTLTDGGSITFDNLTDFSSNNNITTWYQVGEAVPANWQLTTIDKQQIDLNNQTITNTTTLNATGPINVFTGVALLEADQYTLTFNNKLITQPPAINLEKTVNPLSIGEGSTGPVTYTYVLTNADPTPLVDDDPLKINTLVDDNGTPSTTDDFYLVQSGVLQPGVTLTKTGNGDNLLDYGETWTYTISRSIPSQNAGTSHTNNATVSAVDDENTTASDTDDATVTYNNVDPAIKVVKTASTNVVNEGTPTDITYTYELTNESSTSTDPLTVLTISDDQLGNLSAKYMSGDDGDSLLEKGETWLYEATATGVILNAGQNLTNVVKVTAKDDEGTPTDDDDTQTVTGQNMTPTITIDKTGPATVLVGGASVTYNFTITADANNVSTDPVEITSLTDDKLGNLLSVAETAWVNTGKTLQNINGDSDTGIVLNPGQSFSFDYTTTLNLVQGQTHTNTVTVKGVDDENTLAQDDDPHSINAVAPKIDVEKLILDPSTNQYVDADLPVGPVINQGTNPTFKFVVTNTGDVALSNITLSDNKFDLNGAAAGTSITITSLAPNGTYELSPFIAPWQSGQHTNIATVSTTYTDSAGNTANVTDSDAANYYGIKSPGVRTPGFWGNNNWSKFWDGIQGNEPKQAGQANFPTGDLFHPPYTNSAEAGKVLDPVTGLYQTGVLIGDYNRNGTTDQGENTIFYTNEQALQIINASNKVQDDKRYTLARSLVASWLNYLAGNPIDTANPTDKDTRYQINEAIDWLQALTPDENGDKKGDGALAGLTGSSVNSPAIAASSTYWNSGISSTSGLPNPYNLNSAVNYPVDAGNAIHTALDKYNNTGFGADGAFPG